MADLRGANLQGADLAGANLEGADLLGANLQGATLSHAILWLAKDLTIEQLATVKTLYRAKLDPPLLRQVKKQFPHLLEKPKDQAASDD